MPDDSDFGNLEPVVRLTRDLRDAASTLSDREARFLVDSYYVMQELRKRSRSQERALSQSAEPHSLINWFGDQSQTIENQLVRALQVYADSHLMGDWLDQVFGVGPVLSAGFLAYVDMDHCPTVGHLWAYAGMAGKDQKPWVRGERRPWNAQLKTLAWKFSDVAVKFSSDERHYYGMVYKYRKAYELANNESGRLKPVADQRLERDRQRGKVSKENKPYHSKGVLSPGHLELRARRYAAKLFMAHLHNEWYRRKFNTEPPFPYPIEYMNHSHFVRSPVGVPPDQWVFPTAIDPNVKQRRRRPGRPRRPR